MKGFYKKLCDMSAGWCHVYPNARLPNVMGGYDEDPEIFSNSFDYAKDGILNFVGGCCGTFPSHIKAVCENKCCGLAVAKLGQEIASTTRGPASGSGLPRWTCRASRRSMSQPEECRAEPSCRAQLMTPAGAAEACGS